MSTTEKKSEIASESTTAQPRSSVVDAIFDVGTQWAALGLNFGKLALQQSARTLESTAKALEAVANGLETKGETSDKTGAAAK